MIPQEELDTLKLYLEKSEKPLFLFDDDNDGLCSYILFKQFTGKGIGIPIKIHPALDVNMLNKVEEHKPDFIFVLDKPLITQEFVDKANIPVIWLDHHPLIKLNNVEYFNPKKYNKDEVSSTTYWAYKAVKGKLWIAIIGAVSDWTIPDYFQEFKLKYNDLTNNQTNPPALLYDSKLGKLCKILSFCLKGRTSEVNRRIKAFLNVEEPYDILEQKTKEGKYLYKESEKIGKQYNQILLKALKTKIQNNLFVFLYNSEDLSLTSDLSNELLYKNPGKIILVGRKKGNEVRISIRSDTIEINKIVEKALENVTGYGGGHKYAVGANINVNDFEKFVENIKKRISLE